jgi:ABC-type multidrug transport system fused ATPase/permease subunit
MAEIVTAARSAQAHEFIMRSPNGYDTVLDERGGNLSGGQRQRIALARAFLRNAPILVLDEPTAGLDAATEAQLLSTIEKLVKDRTTLLIAHNMRLVECATTILVLDRGRVAEQGTHQQLLERAGVYHRLYHVPSHK